MSLVQVITMNLMNAQQVSYQVDQLHIPLPSVVTFNVTYLQFSAVYQKLACRELTSFGNHFQHLPKKEKKTRINEEF